MSFRLTYATMFNPPEEMHERFEKALCYWGIWVARAWRMRVGEFSVRLGFVEQLDAFAAPEREDPISTVSVGFAWDRWRWLSAPGEGR